MKQLKKISLEKKNIVNLSDHQMRNIKGGDTTVGPICTVVSVATAVVASAIEGYNLGKDESWWNCEHTDQKNCMGDISKVFLNGGCLIPGVDVYGIAP